MPEANKDDQQAKNRCGDPPCPTKTVLCPEVIIIRTAAPPPPAPQQVEKPQAVIPTTNSEEPEHPFTNARDANYAVPRVEQGYTTGAIFQYHTRTHTHHNPSQVYLYPNCNSCGLIQNPWYLWYLQFIFVMYIFICKYN